jgi:hypothetical protein
VVFKENQGILEFLDFPWIQGDESEEHGSVRVREGLNEGESGGQENAFY